MITGKDMYNVLAALVPLYVAMILAYGSVRWWKIFTPDQCSGINRFVAVFAVPLLSFIVIASNDPYSMNYRFIAADSLQKVVILVALFLWNTFTKHGNLDWTITLYALSTLPNTLVMGIPLLRAMYGNYSASLMVQIVVLQSIIWNTLMLFMFEYRGAKLLIAQQFPETAGTITSFKVDSDVVSLNGREPLETDAEIEEDGKLHVVVKRSSNASSMASSFNKSHLTSSMTTPRASNLTEVEIYSVQSLTNGGDVSKGVTPRTSNFEEEMRKTHKKRGGRSMSSGVNELIENKSPGGRGSTGEREIEIVEADTKSAMNGSPLNTCQEKVDIEEGDANKKQQMPPASVMTKLILMMVWRKLIRNPNTYASLLGLTWSLVSYRWHIKMPTIVKGSISILSDAGLGMAMFSLGLFMALQPKIIACGKSKAAFSMAVRFLIGPAVIAATSLGIGLRGDLLRVAIVQAALPQGIITFVFAKEYNLHADLISTAVIFGMMVALPVTILYYVLLGL